MLMEVIESIVLLIVLAIPLMVLFQIGGALFLLRYRRDYSDGKVFLVAERIFLLFCLVIAPLLIFPFASGFSAGYRGEKGDHWFYYIHDEWAGLTLLPVYLIASISLAKAIFNGEYMATSRANYVMVATLAAIAAWYTFATLALRLTDSELGLFKILAIIPAITCFNYLAFLVLIEKQGRLQPLNPSFAFIWFSTLVASLVVKYPLAKRIYEQLPEEIPPSYGDCFIVSAAAKGHPNIVQSWISPTLGKPVNRQWYVFKGFEMALAQQFPRLHRLLRRIYNRVGPFIAKQIRYRWQADLVYLLLKPAEWAVCIANNLLPHSYRCELRINNEKCIINKELKM
jgi:hypothetical protein